MLTIPFPRLLLPFLLLASLCATDAAAQVAAPGRILSDNSGYGDITGWLTAVNVDGTNLISLTPIGTLGEQDLHPSAASNGRIAFQSGRGTPSTWNIWTVNGDGTSMRPLMQNTGGTVQSQYPMISPDGSRIAFISNPKTVTTCDVTGGTAQPYDIYIINSDGADLRQVTPTQVINCQTGAPWSNIHALARSPDGTRLVFKGTRLALFQGTTSFHTVLAFINADGTNETVLDILDSPGASSEVALDWPPRQRNSKTGRTDAGR